jgi:hypothetical protein
MGATWNAGSGAALDITNPISDTLFSVRPE